MLASVLVLPLSTSAVGRRSRRASRLSRRRRRLQSRRCAQTNCWLAARLTTALLAQAKQAKKGAKQDAKQAKKDAKEAKKAEKAQRKAAKKGK